MTGTSDAEDEDDDEDDGNAVLSANNPDNSVNPVGFPSAS
jgi:hypothetical protein